MVNYSFFPFLPVFHMYLLALIGIRRQLHLKSRNKVSTVKWQGEKNNRRRSEINPGKTSERNGWGAFYPFLLFVLICHNRETVHTLLGKGGNSFKFFFFFFDPQSYVFWRYYWYGSCHYHHHHFIIIIIIIIIIIPTFSFVHIFLAIYFLLD